MPTPTDDDAFVAELRERYRGHVVRVVPQPWVWPDASDVEGVLERVEELSEDHQLIVRLADGRSVGVFVHDVAGIALLDGDAGDSTP